MIEDFLAVVEAKRFLGREFLTWLVQLAEQGEGRFAVEGAPIEIRLGDRLTLTGPDGRARLSVAGDGDAGPALAAGLRFGKLVDRARLLLDRGERHWEVTFDGGLFTFDALKCPPLGERDAKDADDYRVAFENDLFLRLADVEDVATVFDALFAQFCRVRSGAAWATETLPALRAWVATL